jgi:hypothetical protein
MGYAATVKFASDMKSRRRSKRHTSASGQQLFLNPICRARIDSSHFVVVDCSMPYWLHTSMEQLFVVCVWAG